MPFVPPGSGAAGDEGVRGVVTDKPVPLDQHRGMVAQKATEIRRRLAEVEAGQAEFRLAELEKFLVSAPALTWREAGEKARYLIMLLAATPAALDPRLQTLIAGVLQGFKKLSTETAVSHGNDRDPGGSHQGPDPTEAAAPWHLARKEHGA